MWDNLQLVDTYNDVHLFLNRTLRLFALFIIFIPGNINYKGKIYLPILVLVHATTWLIFSFLEIHNPIHNISRARSKP